MNMLIYYISSGFESDAHDYIFSTSSVHNALEAEYK